MKDYKGHGSGSVAIKLPEMIEGRSARVCVMGVGYVGLPLAFAIAGSGYKVFCGEINEQRIALLSKGVNPLPDLKEIDEIELKRLVEGRRIIVSDPENASANSDIKVVCVPTPVSPERRPDLTYIKSASRTIGKSLKRGDLVINESSVSCGMTRNIVCEILEEASGMRAGQDFHVVASPERVDPGNSRYTLGKIPKIVGGIDAQSASVAKLFYQKFIDQVIEVSSLEVAEASKMLENSYRALNIGFINEFARFCDASGIDAMEVIKASSTKWSFQPHYPGIGVGGHCIPKDPYYLIARAKEVGVELNTLRNAMSSSEGMPYYVFDLLRKGCAEVGLDLHGARIALFGISYKGNIRELRDSPALVFKNILQQEGIDVAVYDPLFTDKELKSLGLRPFNPKKGQCDIVVVGCDHSQFKTFDFGQLKYLKLIIDGRNILPKQDVPVIGVGTRNSLGIFSG